MRVCVSPLICHQKNGISSFSEQSVILAFVQQTGLAVRGFGSQRHGNRVTQLIYGCPYIPDKIHKRNFIFRQDVFKVNVHAFKAPFCYLGKQICNQILFSSFIIYHLGNQVVAELSRRTERGQSQNGSGAGRFCGRNHECVIQSRRYQLSLCGKSIRENKQAGKIRKSLFQYPSADKRIGISSGDYFISSDRF